MDDEMMEMFQSLEKMAEIVSKMDEKAKKAICDTITRPNAVYQLQTGPNLFTDSNEWVTLIVAITPDNKRCGPACVQKSHGNEEAHKTHYEWQKTIIDCSPMVLKDVNSNQMYFVGS